MDLATTSQVYRKGYMAGYKYCSRCRQYMKVNSNRCPYCRTLLRNSPRKKRNKVNVKYVKV